MGALDYWLYLGSNSKIVIQSDGILFRSDVKRNPNCGSTGGGDWEKPFGSGTESNI